jgi:hypothetical protein
MLRFIFLFDRRHARFDGKKRTRQRAIALLHLQRTPNQRMVHSYTSNPNRTIGTTRHDATPVPLISSHLLICHLALDRPLQGPRTTISILQHNTVRPRTVLRYSDHSEPEPESNPTPSENPHSLITIVLRWYDAMRCARRGMECDGELSSSNVVMDEADEWQGKA